MKVNREKTQDELDSEIPHDHAAVSESPDPSAAAPKETTDSAAQTETPLIGDYDSTGTKIPIC
jgi:hypothetical protein